MLSAYFTPNESEEIKAAQLAWWCDELQDWTREQVVWALREWNRANPRLRPTPGDILKICIEARGRAEAKRRMETMAPTPPKPTASTDPDELARRRVLSAELLKDFAGRATINSELRARK